jgi:anti-anti-sigma regulatory factor
MLRITTISETDREAVLKLEGALAAEWAAELERVCRTALAQRRHVRLDFRDVTWLDRQAITVVNTLRTDGVEIADCPPLIRALLGC